MDLFYLPALLTNLLKKKKPWCAVEKSFHPSDRQLIQFRHQSHEHLLKRTLGLLKIEYVCLKLDVHNHTPIGTCLHTHTTWKCSRAYYMGHLYTTPCWMWILNTNTTTITIGTWISQLLWWIIYVFILLRESEVSDYATLMTAWLCQWLLKLFIKLC